MNQLQNIIQPIAGELDQCRLLFAQSLHHDNQLLDHALSMVREHNGKMMRPILVLLVARLFGDIDERTLNVACAYEAFHTASLVHDDVVDESDERRGQKSVNRDSGNKVAVLVGDYILSNALNYLAQTDCPQLVSIMSDAAKRLADGELLQLYNVGNQEISEQTYFKIISNKTAALFAACAYSSAIICGCEAETADQMRLFGETVGICFQIRDDIFDYKTDDIGKPTCNDMKEGKLTIPVIHALLNAKSEDTKVMNCIAQKVKQLHASQEEILALVEFTDREGGIDYAYSLMNEYAEKAKAILNQFPDSDIRTALSCYVDYVVGRKF